MNTDDTLQRLRAARPADITAPIDSTLLAQIVAQPGDPRLRSSPHRRLTRPAWTRPRVLAGGSAGLAAVAVAATLVFTGGDASPAFAVIRQANGGVLVKVTSAQGLPGADRQLVNMGIKEEVDYSTAPGAARSSAPVACESMTGPGGSSATPTKEPVTLKLGSDNTEVIPAGSQTGAGTFHLSSCIYYPVGPGTAVGNSGAKFLNAHGGQ